MQNPAAVSGGIARGQGDVTRDAVIAGIEVLHALVRVPVWQGEVAVRTCTIRGREMKRRKSRGERSAEVGEGVGERGAMID